MCEQQRARSSGQATQMRYDEVDEMCVLGVTVAIAVLMFFRVVIINKYGPKMNR